MDSNLKIDFYRQRNFGDVLADTFSFVFRNILPMIKMVVVFMGPLFLVLGIVVGILAFGAFSQSLAMPNSNFFAFATGGAAVLYLVIILLVGVVFYALLNSYILRYAESIDGKVTIAQIWEDIKGNWLAYLGLAGIRFAGFLILGLVASIPLLGIPIALILIFLFVSTSLADVVRMNEGVGVGTSLSYSFQLVNTRWWGTFGLYLLVGLIAYVLMFVVLGAMSLLLQPLIMSTIMGGNQMLFIGLIPFYLIINIALSTLFFSLIFTVSSLQYFSLSEAAGRGSEAFDLIDEIGQNEEEGF